MASVSIHPNLAVMVLFSPNGRAKGGKTDPSVLQAPGFCDSDTFTVSFRATKVAYKLQQEIHQRIVVPRVI